MYTFAHSDESVNTISASGVNVVMAFSGQEYDFDVRLNESVHSFETHDPVEVQFDELSETISVLSFIQ